MKLALNDSTGVDGIAVPNDVTAERGRARSPEWYDDKIEMVFVSELPVYFAAEGGVGIEVQVSGQINRIGVALSVDGTRRVGVKPAGIEPDFVLIELFGLLCPHGGRSAK
jgi:hypothetical protein